MGRHTVDDGRAARRMHSARPGGSPGSLSRAGGKRGGQRRDEDGLRGHDAQSRPCAVREARREPYNQQKHRASRQHVADEPAADKYRAAAGRRTCTMNIECVCGVRVRWGACTGAEGGDERTQRRVVFKGGAWSHPTATCSLYSTDGRATSTEGRGQGRRQLADAGQVGRLPDDGVGA